jgi:hypothetical protein
MGYFDRLTSTSFNTAQDGHKLFYPWGAWGRGYVIFSEQQYKRLRQYKKASVAVMQVAGLVLWTTRSISMGPTSDTFLSTFF